MTDRQEQITIELLKLGYTSKEIIREFNINYGNIDDEFKKEVRALAHSIGRK